MTRAPRKAPPSAGAITGIVATRAGTGKDRIEPALAPNAVAEELQPRRAALDRR
jgi:hypothetical protein